MLQCAQCQAEIKSKIIRHEAGNFYIQKIVEHKIDGNKYLERGDIYLTLHYKVLNKIQVENEILNENEYYGGKH